MEDTKTPLLLLHGFPLDARMWRATAEHFAGDRRILAPNAADLLAGEDPPSIAGMARSAAAIAQAEGVDRCVVVGLSMGGYIAQEFVKTFPERVSALVLCDTRAAADTPEAKANRDAMIRAVEENGVPAGTRSLVEKLLYQPDQVLRAQVETIVSEQDQRTIIACIEALRDRDDNTDLLPRINVPALVLAGEQDVLADPKVLRQMADSLPDGTLVIIHDAGHVPPMEQPKSFNAALSHFLASNDL